jgi:ABC-type lipoprotein release transport system permease subunit
MFAVILSIVMKSIQNGTWDNMVNGVVNYYYGFAQIHGAEYWEDKNIDNAIELNSELLAINEQFDRIQLVVPRLESFALASNEKKSTGILVVGIDGSIENELTGLSERLIEGNFLQTVDQGCMVAEGLANKLDLHLHDTLILLSQGYHGASAAGMYPINGILKFGSPELNSQLVYLTLKEAQIFYDAPGMATSLALKIDNGDEALKVVKELGASLDSAMYSVKDYTELLPELMEAKSLDIASANLVLAILYFIVAFGIFGTILMMVKERQYEFGILISIGMQRRFLGAIVWVETLILGLLGAFAGILISIPIVYYLRENPITVTGEAAEAYLKFGMEPVFPASMDAIVFLMQTLAVVAITSILAIYPLITISRIDQVKAMRE